MSDQQIPNLTIYGTKLVGGFNLEAAQPLDARTTVTYYAHLAELSAYEGMIVYVKNDSKHYTYKNSKWEELSSCISTDLGTTVEVGGLPAGTNLQGKSTTEVLESILYPFAVTDLSLLDGSGNSISLPLEYGHDITVAKVIPTFTVGPTPINSINIGTTSGGAELYSNTTAGTGTTITLTTSKTYNDAATGTLYCTLSAGNNSSSKEVQVTRSYYTYYAVTSNTSVPGDYDSSKTFEENRVNGKWIPVGSSSLTDIAISAEAGKYVWIATTTSIDVADDGICEYNELGKAYNNPATTVKHNAKSITNQHGYSCRSNYYFYRLYAPRKKSGIAKFKLGKNEY